MKYIPLLCLFISVTVSAQKPGKDLRSLVKAEKAFSKVSETKNLRDAFVQFFAPNSILIEQGKEINGLEHYKQQAPDSVLLIWEPAYADIASSKDFGFTTGPFKLFKSKTDTTLVASGYYSSMWEKQTTGEWKVIFDLGSGKVEPQVPVFHFSKNRLAKAITPINKLNELNNLIAFDKAYIDKLNTVNKTADASYFSDEGRIHRNRFFPFIGKDSIAVFADPKERSYKFSQLGGRIANSGDMGFTYGNLEVQLKVNGADQIIKVRYFRIWKKEDGKNWKVVLDVLG